MFYTGGQPAGDGLFASAPNVCLKGVSCSPSPWRHATADAVGQVVTISMDVYKPFGNSSATHAAFGVYIDDLLIVPEPATLLLLSVGAAALLRRRRTYATSP